MFKIFNGKKFSSCLGKKQRLGEMYKFRSLRLIYEKFQFFFGGSTLFQKGYL